MIRAGAFESGSRSDVGRTVRQPYEAANGGSENRRADRQRSPADHGSSVASFGLGLCIDVGRLE
jgi:hypothetical protein